MQPPMSFIIATTGGTGPTLIQLACEKDWIRVEDFNLFAIRVRLPCRYRDEYPAIKRQHEGRPHHRERNHHFGRCPVPDGCGSQNEELEDAARCAKGRRKTPRSGSKFAESVSMSICSSLP